ncbi:tyrosine-type recombinase/integrase [Microbispora siamensis]
MSDEALEPRDLARLAIPRLGSLQTTEDPFEPYRLLDPDGSVVVPVSAYLGEVQARGRSVATQRSYGMDLLRWFRFLWAVGVSWDQATQVEARDFSRWIQISDKPRRSPSRSGTASAGAPNSVTGKPSPGAKYATSTRAHSETVLRAFYDFHLETGDGPMVNPFPLSWERRGGRANAHHNPMEPFRHERTGRYRPKVTERVPRCIPDEKFDQLFAQLASHRDRALVALWISTGARAAELLGATCRDTDPGQQLITVIRKGSRRMQQVPASPDAFVWLRLYQAQMHGLVPASGDDPLWWTLRRPFRRLSYHAARAMFVRANAALGSNWTIHDLRHSAAYRMARDPHMPLTDVQWVLGHALLSTTQRYLTPLPADVIENVLAFHERRQRREQPPEPAAGYRPESLQILFGEDRS